jgi:hypothetical protein|tara:strand:+ start:775 stop:975 length:201 start_codon:yes stop_codon:yes gene_type:complete
VASAAVDNGRVIFIHDRADNSIGEIRLVRQGYRKSLTHPNISALPVGFYLVFINNVPPELSGGHML